MQYDEDGFPVIKIKHMIQALQRFNPEHTLFLDKDGWVEKEIPHNDEADLIIKRLFWIGNGSICINN